MIKCVQCKSTVSEYDGVLLTVDGDFACSNKCAGNYKAKRDDFMTRISDPNITDTQFEHLMLH